MPQSSRDLAQMRPASPGPGRGADARTSNGCRPKGATCRRSRTPSLNARWLGLFSGLFSGLLSLPEAPPFCWPAVGASGPAGEGGGGPCHARRLPARGEESAPAPSMCALFQLVGHGSRADQFLEQSLSYLQSSQEPLQEAAVRFIGEPRP